MTLFDDDELQAYYRRIEDRTEAANARPRRRRRREVPEVVFSCPTPEKIAYDDYPAVMGAILAISRASRARPSLRCYECRCGFWHLTSGVPRPD